jgi:hypothetical protein
MTITPTPSELLDTSIAQLRTLAAFLREQLGQGMEGMTSCSAQVAACREALGALSVLIVRLQAAREPLAGAGESEHAGLPSRYDRPRASGTVFEP